MTAPLLTTRDVAERLGLSKATVLRRWRAGEIPGFQLSTNVLRFDEAEITEWLYAQRGRVVTSDLRPGTPGSTPGLAAIPRKETPPAPTEGE